MKNYNYAKLVWEEIVRITDQCKYSEVKGLRNQIFLQVNKKATIHFNFVHFIKIIITLISFPKKLVISKEKNKVLFYIPFNTSAISGNLMPVYEETKRHNKVGLVIQTRKLPLINGAIIKEDIVKYTNYNQRIKSLLFAIKTNINLFSNLSKSKTKLKVHYLSTLYNLFVVFLAQVSFKQILIRTKPISIVSTSDYFPLDYSLFNIANQLNIDNYIIQHGIIGISYTPFTSKYFCAYGKLAKDEMIVKGCKEERIILVGKPSTDKTFNNLEKKQSNGLITPTSNKIIILSETQGTAFAPNVYEAYAKELQQILANNEDIKFYVKLHPAEDSSFYKEHGFFESKSFKILPKNTTLTEAFNMADIAMTIWSTAGLEAMIYGLPLLVIDAISEVHKMAWWPSYNGGIFWSNYKKENGFRIDFSTSNRKILINDQYGFIDKYFSHQGESANKMYHVLTETI